MNRPRKPSFLDKVIGFVTGKEPKAVAQGGDSFLGKLANAIKPSKKPRPPRGYTPPIVKPKAIPRDVPGTATVPTEKIKEYKSRSEQMDELKQIWANPGEPYSVRRQAAQMYVDMAPGPLKFIIQNSDDWASFREVYEHNAR